MKCSITFNAQCVKSGEALAIPLLTALLYRKKSMAKWRILNLAIDTRFAKPPNWNERQIFWLYHMLKQTYLVINTKEYVLASYFQGSYLFPYNLKSSTIAYSSTHMQYQITVINSLLSLLYDLQELHSI